MSQEQWKPIVENPAWGMVSNHGRVMGVRGKIRTTFQTKFGYWRVGFEGGRFTRMVHRLVAEAFIDRNAGTEEINHKDGDKSNNSVENLEWVTKKENIRHSYDLGLREGKGSHRKAILKPEHRPIILEKISCGMTQREIAAEFGVSQPALNVFLRGRKTNHFAWRNPN